MAVLKRLLRVPRRWWTRTRGPTASPAFLGAVFLGLASLALLLGLKPLGYALALLVALLAFVNLAFGFCLGCFLYLHLRYARALFTGK